MSQKRVLVNFRYHTIPYIEISSKKQCLKKKSAPPSYDDSASASGSETQISAAEVVENETTVDDERDVNCGDDVQFSYFEDDGNSPRARVLITTKGNENLLNTGRKYDISFNTFW